MGIGFIIWTIFIFILGGDFAYYFIYSAKARIKNRWKIIRRISLLSRPELGADPEITQKIEDYGTEINFLLKHNFDPIDDSEYIEQNRWVVGKK